MAADQGRFGRLGEIRSCWCPKGIRPVVPKQCIREYIYAYVAVAPELGEMTCLILPHANTQMMGLFLKQVAAEFPNYFIVMQVDRAAWHTSKKLPIPENIRLLPQPAYSPELMPVEHIWDDIRRDYFPNRIVHSIDEVMDKLSDGLKQLASQPEKLRSMTYFPHLRLLI